VSQKTAYDWEGLFWYAISIMADGGTRAGAGRPAGSQNADTAAMRAALSMLLEGQVHIAVAALADIAKSGTSDAAQVSAACAILDRTHGRPRVAPGVAPLHGRPDDPLGGFIDN
tara:strand:+ start:178 stop:519 length:342 start_codon:yes stop_codon:yes gene_type:complete